MTTSGRVYAVSNSTITSTNAFREGQWDQIGSIFYKMFSNLTMEKIVLVNDLPIYVNATGYTFGFGTQCINDISAGVDGAVWALTCETDKDGNSPLIKWDPFLRQWYNVAGVKGIKVGAFNEVSAAVLDKQGRIFVSSDTGN